MNGLRRFLGNQRLAYRRLVPLVAAIFAISMALPAQAQDEEGAKPKAVDTGNDPRDFGSKFMPYYRYTELKNGLKADDFAIFGMWAITKNFALTYETSIGKRVDIRDTAACAGLPAIDCTGSVPGGGFLPNGLPAEGDGVEVGMGDTILRMFWNVDATLWGGAVIPGLQVTLPTATDPTLGSETVSGGPIITFVWDLKKYPAPGAFFAMMNIFEVDWMKDTGRGEIGRYMGRWFLQLPINKKHKLYILTEFQPVYDWEAEHFSFWFAPEFGKAFAPSPGVFRNGGAIYIKPGFGVNPDALYGDREFTVELGVRFFFGKRGPDSYDVLSMHQ
jgi:hypothetical protein